jgi:hypothetical protein
MSASLKATVLALDALYAGPTEARESLLESSLQALPLAAFIDDESYEKDSELALPEKTSRLLSNGDLLDINLFQISASNWLAKDADNERRFGSHSTRELAIRDLVEQCEAELEEQE